MSEGKPTSLVPACPNCNHSMEGIAPGDACPECGARRLVPDVDHSWLVTVQSGMRLLCWTTPLALLAYVAPYIASTGDSNQRPLIGNPEWFLLVGAVVAAGAMARLARCGGDGAAVVWVRRMGPVMVLAMVAWSAAVWTSVIYAVPFAGGPTWIFNAPIWSCLTAAIVAAWCVLASRVIASLCGLLGLPRQGARLRRWVLAGAVLAMIFQIWADWWPEVEASLSSSRSAASVPSPVWEQFATNMAYNGCVRLEQFAVTGAGCLVIYVLLEMQMAIRLNLESRGRPHAA